jgi:uncharacterized OB-fold protein
MSVTSIEQFYAFCSQKKLMGVKCEECGALYAIPKPLCLKCSSKKLSWVPFKGVGKLASYTIVHIPHPRFQNEAPYILGVIELEESVKLLARIKNVKPEDIKIGMPLKVDFEKSESETWPNWPRYFFTPI